MKTKQTKNKATKNPQGKKVSSPGKKTIEKTPAPGEEQAP